MSGNQDAIARACAAAGRDLGAIWHEQAQWYAEGGPERVAAMGFPGAAAQQQAEKAALYERLRHEAGSESAA